MWNEARKCRKVAVWSSRHLGIENPGLLEKVRMLRGQWVTAGDEEK